jgi:hypothetical protein
VVDWYTRAAQDQGSTTRCRRAASESKGFRVQSARKLHAMIAVASDRGNDDDRRTCDWRPGTRLQEKTGGGSCEGVGEVNAGNEAESGARERVPTDPVTVRDFWVGLAAGRLPEAA